LLKSMFKASSCRAKNSKAHLTTRRSYTAVAIRFCASHSLGQRRRVGARRHASCASWLRLDLDDHHEEAMRAESRCSTATAETASVRPKRSKEMRRVGALSGIAAHADGSEVGGGHIVVTRGRRWFLRCNSFVLRAREAGAGLRRAREARRAVEGQLQHRCPRNNTWHRPKLSTGVRDRSVRTQCTSLSHGGARAPEIMLRPLSEDKTASTIDLRAVYALPDSFLSRGIGEGWWCPVQLRACARLIGRYGTIIHRYRPPPPPRPALCVSVPRGPGHLPPSWARRSAEKAQRPLVQECSQSLYIIL